MSQYYIAQGKTKTIQAAQPITAAAAGVVTVTSTAGWENGDLALVSGVAGATGVNGLCLLGIASGTSFTLKNPSTGATLTFGGSYTSGGTVTHIGFQTAALALDNTVFTNPNPDFTLRTNISALSTGAGVRVHVSDTGDAFANDIKPGPCVSLSGFEGPGDQMQSFRRADFPSLRLGSANNALRVNVFVEGLNGSAPATGASATFSTWIEA